MSSKATMIAWYPFDDTKAQSCQKIYWKVCQMQMVLLYLHGCVEIPQQMYGRGSLILEKERQDHMYS